MKKIIALLLFIMIVTGCKKTATIYQQHITGTWFLYKYILLNTDYTLQFDSAYPNYSITFTSSGVFLIADSAGLRKGGTYHFTSNNQVLALDDTLYQYIDSVTVPALVEQDYTIFDLTSESVQLRNDTSQLYLQKQQL